MNIYAMRNEQFSQFVLRDGAIQILSLYLGALDVKVEVLRRNRLLEFGLLADTVLAGMRLIYVRLIHLVRYARLNALRAAVRGRHSAKRYYPQASG